MPCRFFEPQRVAADARHPRTRLPLIDEYDGFCHAAPERVAVPEELRFRSCNHGYSRGTCAHFPESQALSGFRYTVLRCDAVALEILCVEERDYAPARWFPVRFLIAEQRLDTDTYDACVRAQAMAFCRSYLARFSD
jgi:hypothetical protein